MKKTKITFYVITGLLSMMLLYAVVANYILNTEVAKAAFESLGYPPYLVYPVAIAKIAGIVILWGQFNRILLEWAYAGFAYIFILAALAHISVGDGQFFPAVISMLLLAISYFLNRKLENGKNND